MALWGRVGGSELLGERVVQTCGCKLHCCPPLPLLTVLQWVSFKHELGINQLRSLNIEIKGGNDHKQEADENLLQGHRGKEEDQKYKHVLSIVSKKFQMIRSVFKKSSRMRREAFKERCRVNSQS